jgi:uncharacterized protein (TIGR00369 family)
MDLELKLDAAQLEALLARAFPSNRGEPFMHVEDLQPGRARVRMPFRSWMLRPGNSIAGPALFTAADMVMYVLVMAHVGPELMAVTSDMTMHFLTRGKPGDLVAHGKLLKLGRRLAVMDCEIFSAADPETLVAHVSGSYALPVKPT